MAFSRDLLGNKTTKQKSRSSGGKKSGAKKELGPRGCDRCPLNTVGVRKIKGLARIKQRRMMLWAQNPGRRENQEGLELVGPSGQLVWDTARDVGFSRADVDVQNVVRCYTIDDTGEEHSPTKEELHCCSIYNERALELNGGKAAVHLILGKVAGVQLLGRAYKKDKPVFWHEPWKAYVVLTEHPSYLLRLGGKKKAGWKYYHFRDMFAAAKSIMDCPGRYGYVLSRGYRTIQTMEGLQWLDKTVRREAAAGRRVAVDIEDGEVDGQKVLLLCGFSWGHLAKKNDWSTYAGGAATVVLDHPEGRVPPELKESFKAWLRAIMEDSTVGKSLQHGSYDQPELERHLDCRVRGYTFDSQYGAYLRFPHLRSYSLANLAMNFFPEFGDYKTMVTPYFVEGKCNMARVPLKILAPYNCADADLTKRVELKVGGSISQPLLEVYINAAFTLEDMEGRGPWLDMENLGRVKAEVPKEVDRIHRRLQRIAENPEFNPNSPPQVAGLLYDKLQLGDGSTRSTGKEILQILSQTTKHTAPALVIRSRALSKVDSTYLDGWARSAELHGGQLRTAWWLTGAASSRLRSGGGGEGIVNFQNFHGNFLLLDLLVSDPKWRQALADCPEDLYVFLASDYSQVEIRMLAELSGDPLLIQQLNSSEDIHCQVGHSLTGWPVSKISEHKMTRKLVKNMHFGIIFGLGRGESLYNYLTAKGVETTMAKSNRFYDKYFHTYKGVSTFIDRMRKQAEDDGYVETLFGFRREMGVWDDNRSTYWGNQAVNTPVQGTAHQLLLMAIALLRQKRKTYRLLQRPVLEIHDALYFFVRLRDLAAARGQLQELLQEAVPRYVKNHFGYDLRVPLLSESEAGFTLGSMTEYAGEPVGEFLPRWRKTREEHLAEGWKDLGMEAI